MESHPLNPMTDSDIRRWLAMQTAGSVGHVGAGTVLEGAAAIRAGLDAAHEAGHRLIVVDTIRDADLVAIGEAVADLPLLTGGSGIALGLPANFRKRGELAGRAAAWQGQPGPCIVLSGSCSKATRAQVETHARDHPARAIDVADVIEGRLAAPDVADWLTCEEHRDAVPLAYSSSAPSEVRAAQERFGQARCAAALEGLFAEVARLCVAAGTTRLVTAGGETSGAVVEGLAPDALAIGPEIAPGVPAMRAGRHLVVALKSGNFGAPDFFAHAARVLEAAA